MGRYWADSAAWQACGCAVSLFDAPYQCMCWGRSLHGACQRHVDQLNIKLRVAHYRSDRRNETMRDEAMGGARRGNAPTSTIECGVDAVLNIVIAINKAKEHFTTLICQAFLNVGVIEISTVPIYEATLAAASRS